MRALRLWNIDRPWAAGTGWALDAVVPAWGGLVLVVLAVLLYAATREGPAVTPDSVQYLSAAQGLSSGHGLTTSITELGDDARREPFAWWPPLYPALLAAGSRLGWSAVDTARWVAVAAVLIGVALTGMLALELAGPGAARASVVLYGLLFSTTMTGSFVWSEPVYTALVAGSLLCVARGVAATDRDLEPLFWAGLLAGLAMLTRYMGVVVVAGIGLGVTWVSLHLPWRRTATRVTAFLVPALAPNLVWLARNRLLTGGAFGPLRPETAANADGTLVQTAVTLARDSFFPLTPLGGGWALAGVAAGTLALVLLAVAVLGGDRHVHFTDDETRSGLGIVLWAYAMTYLAGLGFFVTRIQLDPVNPRYLAPVYPVLVVLLVSGVRGFVAGGGSRRSHRGARRALAAAFLVLVAVHLTADAIHVSAVGQERRGLTSPYWTSVLPGPDAVAHDPGLARIAALAGPEGLVISNRWELAGLATRVPAKPLPEPGEAAYPERLFAFPGAVIAVHRPSRQYRVTAAQLHDLAAARGDITFVEDAGDWSLFRIGARARPDPEGKP